MGLPAQLTPSPVPLRRIVRSSSNRRKRAIRSIKAAGAIECESDHEARFAILAELDPNVTRIYSQAFHWPHWFEGKKRHHWPDFGLVIGGKLEIHEVKPLAKLHDDVEWKTRCDWAEWSAGHGVPYSVALDKCDSEPVSGLGLGQPPFTTQVSVTKTPPSHLFLLPLIAGAGSLLEQGVPSIASIAHDDIDGAEGCHGGLTKLAP